MRNLVQVREEIARKAAEAEAIVNLAREEKRELSADETARVDNILGVGDKPGELASLRIEEARALKIENMQADILARSNPAAKAKVPGAASTRIEIANSVRRPSRLALGNGVLNRVEQEELTYGIGRFFAAALFNHEPSREWCREHGVQLRNAMTEGVDSKGGVLLPDQYEPMLIRLVNDYGVARRECGQKVMTSDTLTCPRRTGGFTTYYPAEGGTITASDMTLDSVKLTAKKLACLGRFSAELNEDSLLNIGNELSIEGALSIASAEDSATFIGDGTSTYGRIVGIKSALLAGSEVTAATGHTAFSTLTIDDFHKMLSTVQTYALKFGNAKWYISRAGWASSMQRLALASGGVTSMEIGGGTMPMFLGYPVVWVEVMNSTLSAQTSTEGLCFFGDLRQSVFFGDRRGISVAVSNDVYFTSDETAIRFTERYDVNVHDAGTASASGGLVQLLTPGS
jgi:HK97 family phage major capsid protein